MGCDEAITKKVLLNPKIQAICAEELFKIAKNLIKFQNELDRKKPRNRKLSQNFRE